MTYRIGATATGTTPGKVTNTATVKLDSGTADTNTANDTSSVDVTIQTADLTVTKTASKAVYLTGEQASWTVTVSNTNALNSTTSSTYTLRDVVPSTFTDVVVIGGSPACAAVTNNTVTCDNQAGLVTGGTRTYTITATARTATTAYTNTAELLNTSFERSTDNNTASATGQIQATEADLAVTKTATPLDPIAGQTVTFDIKVSNVGNATSSTYTLTDAVPSQFTNVNFSGTPPGGCSITGNAVNCTSQATLAAGASRDYKVTAVATTAGAYTNKAELTGTTDKNTANNTSSVTGTIAAATSDLTISKTATPTTGVKKGATVTYTVEVANSGNVPSSTYTLTDPVPAAFTNVTVATVAPATTACTVTNNTVTCLNQAALAPNAKRTYTITAVANETVAGTHTNTATIADTTGEASTTNNSASVDVGIIASAPDLLVTKTAPTDKISINQPVEYTVTVTNVGDQASGAYTLSDKVPGGFGLAVTAEFGCSLDQATRTVNCPNRTSLAAGESRTYKFTMTAGDMPQPTLNKAFVTPVAGEVVTTNNEATAPVEIIAESLYDLSVSKGASQGIVQVGETVDFTITVTNAGVGPSDVYSLRDEVPSAFASVDFVGVRPDECSVLGNIVTCTNLPSLAAGATRTFTIKANAVNAGTATNTASASTVGETNTTNNSGSAPVTIQEAGGPLVGTADSNGGAFTLDKST
ncbi:hypothetical protein [Granulicoccus sp. GXG6511]|uniref:hypothetical protein n=1 Tax=Granulicoccus sp. GXG6511 TaxID=3381351 RepID=UPI003D7EF943